MNGVSQSGVEERRQQQIRYPRPESAKPIPSPKPPVRGQGVTNAWGDVYVQHTAVVSGIFSLLVLKDEITEVYQFIV